MNDDGVLIDNELTDFEYLPGLEALKRRPGYQSWVRD